MDKMIVIGNHDEATVDQMRRASEPDFVSHAILCADGHLGYGQPVGGVIASKTHISMSGVGFDIGCGTLAVQTDMPSDQLDHGRVADEIASRIPFGLGHCNGAHKDDELFDEPGWDNPDVAGLREQARHQLGSVGSGNHYVDVFTDTDGMVWVGVHFGSRGFGHKTATAFYKEAGAKDGIEAPCCFVEASSELGQRYIAAMELALRYAERGRRLVVNTVLDILGASEVCAVSNHHNMAHLEKHGGEDVWVARKGSQTAFHGERAYVGGSMGTKSFIVEGVGGDEAVRHLHSVPHGAGRLIPRGRAKREIKFADALRTVDCVVRGAGSDETPACYRDVSDVLRLHRNTLRVVEALTPEIVVMAGANDRDPYRD